MDGELPTVTEAVTAPMIRYSTTATVTPVAVHRDPAMRAIWVSSLVTGGGCGGSIA
jgi:hypothetical protein